MIARRTRLLAAAAAASAVLLAGCGSGDTTDAPDGPLASVEVTGGGKDEPPEVKLDPSPLTVSETTTRVLKEGDGAETTEDDIVLTDYVVVNGKDGSSLDNTYAADPLGFDLGSDQLLSGLRTALTGEKVGSRLLVAVPPAEAFGDQGNAQLGITGEDTLVFVVDLRDTVKPLDQAEGAQVDPKKGDPKVTWKDGKAAEFTMPKADPPSKTTRSLLVKGKGDKVAKGDTVIVTYTGALWRNGKVFDSSFNHSGTFQYQVGAGQVIAAWDQQLVGQRVGSRLLLTVPPKDGYGASGSGDGTIKGDDTIVFVIDVLAAY